MNDTHSQSLRELERRLLSALYENGRARPVGSIDRLHAAQVVPRTVRTPDTGEISGWMPRWGSRSAGRWNRSVGRRLAIGISVIPVLIVVAVVASIGGGSGGAGVPASAASALNLAARAAGAGSATPKLRAGQAWYTTSIQLRSSLGYAAGAPARKTLSVGRVRIAKWIGADGEESTEAHPLSGHIRVASASIGTPSDAAGFGDWDFSQPRSDNVQAFPTTVRGVERVVRSQFAEGYLDYTRGNYELNDTDRSAFTQLAELTSLLADWPLRPASRAAVYQTIARLPGLRYLGATDSPLGRLGVAVAEDRVGLVPFELGANSARQSYRFEMIFDPATGQVLGSRTIALASLPTINVSAGAVLFSWAYQSGKVVPATDVMKDVAKRQRADRRLKAPGGPCHVTQPTPDPQCRKARQRILRGLP